MNYDIALAIALGMAVFAVAVLLFFDRVNANE